MPQRINYVVLFIVFLPLTLNAQWTELGTPGDNAIYSLGNEGDTIYAGTQFDLIRSTNNGSTWELKDSGLPSQLPAISITTLNGVVLAGSDGSGMYASTNHGDSWVAANIGLPALARSVRVVYAHSGRAYLGISGDGSRGFYYSTDDGSTWSTFSNGPDTTVTAIVGSGDTLAAGTISGKVYVSTNLGETWRDTVISPLAPAIRGIAMVRSSLFVTTAGYGVYRSPDAGLTWTQVNNGFTDNPAWVRPIAVIDTTLFTGIDGSGNGGVWRSTNKGDLWENVSGIRMTVTTAPPIGTVNVYYKQYVMLAHGSVLFAGTFGYGMLKSTDRGSTWSQVTVPFRYVYLPALTAIGDTLYTGGPDIEAAFVSTDKGLHWESYRANMPAGVSSFAKNGPDVFTGVYPGALGYGAFKSTNGGVSWAQTSTGLPVSPNNMLIQDSGALYAATEAGLYKSTNNGGQWNITGWINSAAGVFAQGSMLIVSRLSPQRTYRSTNGGVSWDSLGGGLPLNFAARSFATIGARVFMCGTGSSSTLFVSTDNGANWSNVTGATQAVQVLSKGDTVWVNGITPFYSTNFGQSWTAVSTSGVPGGGFSKIAIAGGWLFGAVGGSGQKGLYRRALPGTVNVHEHETEAPASFTLHQNYPNPFNPTTIIQFVIPTGQVHTSLRVYDMIGREVATLLNEVKGPGIYSVQWNASGLASGVYFYKLQTHNHIETRKLLLLR